MKTDNRSFIYIIDADDVIVSVNEEWLSFAAENNTEQLTSNTVLQKSLWNFIVDSSTRHVYQLILQKVRKQNTAVRVPFRCDSPNCRRFMEMEVRPCSGNLIQFKSRILKLEYRDPVPLLDSAISRTDEFLAICSWCKRVRIGADYVEIENAVKLLGLFDTKNLPRLTHGICPDCAEMYSRR